jgi:hypothetical protein
MALWYSHDLGATSVQFHRIEYAYGTRIEATAVNLPIQFPDDADVIAEEAARFRALSSDSRVRALGDCFRDYLFLTAASDRAEELSGFAQEEERQTQTALREFVARHE